MVTLPRASILGVAIELGFGGMGSNQAEQVNQSEGYGSNEIKSEETDTELRLGMTADTSGVDQVERMSSCGNRKGGRE